MKSVIEIANGVRSGKLSARSVLEESIRALDAKNAPLCAFVMLRLDEARAEADAIDARVARGEDPGALAGVPFGVKDLENLTGLPTTQGSLLLADAPPAAQDSPHVARLRAAGAIAIGKTNVPEFGMDSSTYNRVFGVTRNPWNLATTPGGSSGGSAAAVAVGIVPFATSTDGGGSTREPASYTNLIGLKPSHGRIAKDGGFSNWAVHGALTFSVADTARYLDVACGPDDRDRQSLPLPGYRYEDVIHDLDVAGMRAVWSDDLGYAVVEPEVVDITRRAAERLIDCARLQRVPFEFKPTNAYRALGMINLSTFQEDMTRAGTLPARYDDLAPQTRFFLDRMRAMSIGPNDIVQSWAKVRQLERDMAGFFKQADLLLTPATACAPYAADSLIPQVIDGRDASESGVEPFGMVANICWNPSISIPAGFTGDGRPVGLQIIGRRHRDDVMLRLARLYEEHHPWERLKAT